MERNNIPSRRKFLGQLGAISAGSLLGVAGQLPLAARAFAAGNYSNITDYKSLVCVFLDGGADTHSAYVPYNLGAYNEYAALRQGLAIPRGDLLPGAGSAIGFHPALSDLRTLFNEDKLAVAANLGNLFEPMSRDDLFDFYQNGGSSIAIPHELFSHEHQAQLIQMNVIPTPGSNPPGWGGLMLDRLQAASIDPSFPAAYSVAGNNPWQTGESTQPFSVRAGQDIPRFEHFSGDQYPPWEGPRSDRWQEIIAASYSHALEAQAASMMAGTANRSALLRDALASAPALSTPFDSDNWLALQLRSAAELISIREDIGTRRQFFFVRLSGWDTHGDHLNQHGSALETLNGGLFSFLRTLEELGVSDSVTTFTFSEFGRTLTINGDGTDHAWASDQVVMGGAVDGGKVHGTPIAYQSTPQGEHWNQPLFGPADVGTGRFVPQDSMDQYGATLARWMGIVEADIDAIFPNIGNFSERDLGFMQS